MLSTVRADILELRDVISFKAEPQLYQDDISLKVSGLAFHSALGVVGYKTERVSQVLWLRIELALVKPGVSGSFEYLLPVGQDINEIRFGNEGKVIWIRPRAAEPAAPNS